jgi:hypothetical protein
MKFHIITNEYGIWARIGSHLQDQALDETRKDLFVHGTFDDYEIEDAAK